MSELHRPHRCPRRHHSRAFSLIELMIAVAIIALLAGVAYPSFMDSIRKGRRSEAFSALSAVQQAQERFRSNNAGYSANLTNPPGGVPPGLGLSATTPSGLYSIALSDVGNNTYVASATAVSGTSQAHDGNCVRLGVRLTGGTVEYASAAGAGAFAWGAANRCWSR